MNYLQQGGAWVSGEFLRNEDYVSIEGKHLKDMTRDELIKHLLDLAQRVENMAEGHQKDLGFALSL